MIGHIVRTWLCVERRPMSTNCKIVKGISLVLMLLAIGSIIFAITGVMGADAVAEAAGTDALPIKVASVVLGVVGIFEFFAGAFGVRGANNPTRLSPFIMFGIVMVIANIVEIALAVMGGSGPIWLSIVYAAAMLVAVFCALRAKNEALR